VNALKTRVASDLSHDMDDIGIFDDQGNRLESNAPIYANQVIFAGLLAPLVLRTLVPEGPSDADGGGSHPLAGVVVEVDGLRIGETNEEGVLELAARVGVRRVRLLHPCFSGDGHEGVHHLTVGPRNEHVFLGDVRVYAYATSLMDDTDEDEPDKHGPAAPISVWLCADPSAIPDEAIGFTGKIWSMGFDGQNTKPLQVKPDECPFEYVLLHGRTAERKRYLRSVLVSSVKVQAELTNHLWRPKDPSPLVEREGELGPGEYVRLLGCPVVMGFLDPIVYLRLAGEHSSSFQNKPLELSASEYSTVSELTVAAQHHFDVPSGVWLFRDGVRL
jgi:hypothetical protein